MLYVEGRKGQTFTLKFKNNSGSRVLVVPSIDGLSTMDGKPAAAKSGGYIVDAFGALDVKGWRTSLSESAKFEFDTKSGSYAGKTVGETNCGVIGCLVYSEKEKPQPEIREIHHHHNHWNPPHYNPWFPTPTTTPKWPDIICNSGSTSILRGASNSLNQSVATCNFMAHSAPTAEVEDYNLGTKFGSTQSDAVTEVEFENGVLLAELYIYYTDRAGLIKAGIDVEKKPKIVRHPQAFTGFCQPPK